MKSTPRSYRYLSSPRRLLTVILLLCMLTGILAGFFSWQEVRSAEAATQRAEKAAADLIAFKEVLKTRPVYIDLSGAQPVRAIVEDYSQPDSLWVMANKGMPLADKGYVPMELALPDVPTRTDKSVEERSVRKDLIEPLNKMFAAAEAEGHMLMIGSAYRSPTLQAMYFNGYVQSSGVEAAKMYSAEPGHSEHQTGLSVDISTLSQQCYLSECFITTPDGVWLANNAHKYGFHMRYPQGKEHITGYNFEPWHYRYVGVELATALHESNLTLEEAWPYLEQALETLKRYEAI